MKYITASVGLLTISAAPALSISDSVAKNTMVNQREKKLLFFYKGKFYSSKKEIFREYILNNPNFIQQKQVIGDIDKATIDFGTNMLNKASLPDFDINKIYPVYLMPNGNYERDFSTARSAQINPALTTNDYTDGFNNFFKNQSDARSSYRRKVFKGDMAVENIKNIDGTSNLYNPLSTADYEEYRNKSLQYIQNNGVLTNGYRRRYYKNNQQVNDIYDIFNNSTAINSSVANTVSLYTQMQALKNPNNILNASLPIYNKNIEENSLSNSLNTDNSVELNQYATSVKLENYSQSISDYKKRISTEIINNIASNANFDNIHKNDYNDSSKNVNLAFARDKSHIRYTFDKIVVSPANAYDSDDDTNGDYIKFNGFYQTHNAPYYQRFVNWDADADSDWIAAHYDIYFKDAFDDTEGSIRIYINNGRDTNGQNEDYLSMSILNNRLFDQNVPVWGGVTQKYRRTSFKDKNINSHSDYPWIIGDHDYDSGSDNEWGSILQGIDAKKIIDNGGPISFYDGDRGNNGIQISNYIKMLTNWLNNPLHQQEWRKSITLKTKKIYMSNYELEQFKSKNPQELKNYFNSNNILDIYGQHTRNSSEVRDWNVVKNNINFDNFHISGRNLVFDYRPLRVNLENWGIGTIREGTLSIPIYNKNDWLGENEVLKQKYKDLSELPKGNYLHQVDNIFDKDPNFDVNKSILDSDNNSLNISYKDYKNILSSNLNTIYLDVTAANNYRMSYRLNLSDIFKSNRIFSNLFDNSNILDKDKDNIYVTIDFSKIQFQKNSNREALTGIEIKWHLKKKYEFSQTPINLNMDIIGNQSIKRDALHETILELIRRKRDYNLTQEELKSLNDFLWNSNDIKEVITLDNKSVFKIVRNKGEERTNNITGLDVQAPSTYDNSLFFDPIKDDDLRANIIDSYDKGYLQQFKALVREAELKDYSSLNDFGKITYYYIKTLQDFINNSSIVGDLPSAQNFKLPDLSNVMINLGVIEAKDYLVQNQYSFNGSILKQGISHIGKESLFGQGIAEQAKFDAFRNRIINAFMPPRVTRLYDINGKQFVIDDKGSLLYDKEEMIIANARFKTAPKLMKGLVFYKGLPRPILNQVSLVYHINIDGNEYYFKDIDSTHNFIKKYLDRFIQIVDGGNYD